MTDIVERLRIRQPLLGTLCDEAAAEIERLTNLLAEWESHAGPYKDAEIERLRAALQAMMDGEPNAAQLAARALEPKP